MLYMVPCEQPTACAISSMDTHTSHYEWFVPMLHCGFSWHLCRRIRMLPISDALPSLVKLLDPMEHSLLWETVVTIHGMHFTMHFFYGQSFGPQKMHNRMLFCFVHSCNTPAIMPWLPLTDRVPKWLDKTSMTNIHMLPSAYKQWMHNVQIIPGKRTFATYIDSPSYIPSTEQSVLWIMVWKFIYVHIQYVGGMKNLLSIKQSYVYFSVEIYPF